MQSFLVRSFRTDPASFHLEFISAIFRDSALVFPSQCSDSPFVVMGEI